MYIFFTIDFPRVKIEIKKNRVLDSKLSFVHSFRFCQCSFSHIRFLKSALPNSCWNYQYFMFRPICLAGQLLAERTKRYHLVT